MTPQVSVCLVPEAPYPSFVSRARRLEQAGCARVWVYCNVLWRQRPDADIAGPLSALSAILGATRTLHAGLLVASPNLYHPVVLAKEILSLDALSGGRAEIVLGSGATGSGDPATDAGIRTGTLPSRAQRTEVFADFVQAFGHAVALSRDPSRGGWTGRHYGVQLHRLTPPAREGFGFGVAANGSRGIRLAAGGSGRWVTSLPVDEEGSGDLDRLGALGKEFDAACAERDPAPGDAAAAPVTRTVFVPLNEAGYQRSLPLWREFLATAGGAGFDEVVLHSPRPHDPGLAGPSAEVFAAAFPGLEGGGDE